MKNKNSFKQTLARLVVLLLGILAVGNVHASLTVTPANQQGSLPFTPSWTPPSDSLIAGLLPTSAGGIFDTESCGRNVDSLTVVGSLTISSVPGGGGSTCSSNYVTCGSGAGSNIVYTLPASANGYNITNIAVYGGWTDGGRDQQGYTVYYATAANPSVFTALTSVNYDPSAGGSACSTCVTIADSAGGVVVSNVVALEFDFTSPDVANHYAGYNAIIVEGTAASGSHPVVAPANQQGSLPFTPSWTLASDSLIAGLAPTTALGNFNVEGGANVDSLTAGGSLTIDSSKINYLVCGDGSGAGSTIVYTLPASANGYNLTNIAVYGGWTDGGRDAQDYTVRYATAANPTVFTALTSVSYLPSNPGGAACSTCVTITNSAGGVLASNVVAVEFDFTTPPSENGYCGYAAITVEGTVASGSHPVVTPANQQGSLPFTPSWTPASGSLIAGLLPTTADGNFSLEAAGRNVDSLTSGGSLTIDAIPPGNNTTTTNYVTCGNGSGAGSDIVYTLPASPNGYNLTNITVYGGWINNGRDQQGYTVWYATAANPSTFIALTSVSYDPAAPGGVACATRVSITDSAAGVLVSNVAALKFDFTNPTTVNGYTGYGTITVEGIAASGSHPVVTTANQQGSLPFTPSWTPASDSLIAGLAPTTALGDFSLEVAGRNVDSLTSGGSLTIDYAPSTFTCTTNYVTCGDNNNGDNPGSNIVYTLPASTNGYNLTNITVYGGWVNNGRDQQGYTVSYATAAAPSTFIALTTVSYDPGAADGVACATRAIITDSAGGVVASNVVAVEFDFTTPVTPNHYTGYGAITVQAASVSNAPPVLSGGVWLGGGQFKLTFSGPSGQTYHVLTSTNVALPLASWTVLSSGTFAGSPASYTDTQATNKAQFYGVVSP